MHAAAPTPPSWISAFGWIQVWHDRCTLGQANVATRARARPAGGPIGDRIPRSNGRCGAEGPRGRGEAASGRGDVLDHLRPAERRHGPRRLHASRHRLDHRAAGGVPGAGSAPRDAPGPGRPDRCQRVARRRPRARRLARLLGAWPWLARSRPRSCGSRWSSTSMSFASPCRTWEPRHARGAIPPGRFASTRAGGWWARFSSGSGSAVTGGETMKATDIERRSQEVAEFLRQEVLEAPYRTLGMALIAGYVLAGGLTPRLMWLLMTTGGRAMAGNLVTAAFRGAFDQRRRI